MEKSHPSEIRKKILQIPGKNGNLRDAEKLKADRHPARKNGIGTYIGKIEKGWANT